MNNNVVPTGSNDGMHNRFVSRFEFIDAEDNDEDDDDDASPGDNIEADEQPQFNDIPFTISRPA